MSIFIHIKNWCTCQKHLFFLFVLVLTIPNFFLFYTEQLPLLSKICNIVLPAAAYWLLMSGVRKPGIMLWILFPFLFLGAFQLVLLYLFGESIIAVDMFLNLTTTNSGEALELLDKLLPSVVGVSLLYLPTLALGVVSICLKEKLPQPFLQKNRRWAAISLGGGILLLVLCYATNRQCRLQTDLYPANVCYNIALAVERDNQSRRYFGTSDGFSFKAVPTHDQDTKEIYLLVVGETGRAMNWSLYGYDRNTNPKLSGIDGLCVFRDVLTQSNATHKSVPILLSAASAENYDCLYRQKGIISAFREVGFYTAFYSNQLPNHSFIDFLGGEADESSFIREQADPNAALDPHDDKLLARVSNLLKKDHRKLLVVLHTYGSHFNYRERYPDSLAVFKPDNVEGAKPKYRKELINAYDNTIVYTDRLLAQLISLLRQSEAMSSLLYTSDHGEDIFDDRRGLFLHASPVPTYYQLHVPFIIWMSSEYRNNHPELYTAAQDHQNKAFTSNVLFHTLLNLGGIDTPHRNDSLSVVSTQFTEMPRFYLNDHNRPRPIDRIGLKKEDFDQFKKRGLKLPSGTH